VNITVFGIGYVGAVVAGCMADQGHNVLAVDVSKQKVDLINSGQSPLAEPGLPEIIDANVKAGRLLATTDGADAFAKADVSFICVGTPGLPSGKLDMSYIVGISEDLGKQLGALHSTGKRRTVVFRSTMVPGTMTDIVKPILERASGLKAGPDFGLGYMPEFLREGQGVDDFVRPATVIIGSNHEDAMALLRGMNEGNGGQIFECDFGTAEAIKFTNNAWHALKIAFANEIGSISKASGVDGRKVMEILCADTKLNVSRAYMRPGFAFGGSCLPKDVKALSYHALSRDVRTHVLPSLLVSNDAHISRAVDIVSRFGKRRVALLGLTFKPDTDDLRDSPLVELAERLIGKGFDLRIFDPNFSYDSIVGRNRRFIQTTLPHVASLIASSLPEAVSHGETIIVGHKTAAFAEIKSLVTTEHHIVDLASGAVELAGNKNYEGICW
jgi:GDP-mannose 6-dehydrogenase